MTEPDLLENGRPERRRRRPVLVATVLTALAVVGAAVTPTVVSASRSTSTPAPSALGDPPPPVPPAPDCPLSTIPAPDGSGEYGIYVRADITDLVQNIGWSESRQFWQAFVTGFSAQACGILHLPSLRVEIPKDKIVFDTSKANIGVRATEDFYLYRPGDLNLVVNANAPATNEITRVRPGNDGRLDLTATTSLHAVLTKGKLIYPGPINCPVDLTTPLTTGRSTVRPPGRGPRGPVQVDGPDPQAWTLEGTPLSGPLQSATATIVGNTFEFPLFPTTDCPVGAFSNPLFAGSDEAGESYCTNGLCSGPQPPGVAQITGKLHITAIDPGALFTDGPPATLPGAP